MRGLSEEIPGQAGNDEVDQNVNEGRDHATNVFRAHGRPMPHCGPSPPRRASFACAYGASGRGGPFGRLGDSLSSRE